MKTIDRSTPVLVLNTEQYSGLGIVRSLGRLGVPVYGLHWSPNSPALHSRYCQGRFLWDINSAPQEQTVDFLLDAARRIGRRPVLIPTSDGTALFVAVHAGALREQYHFPQVSPELVRMLSEKKAMYEEAARRGIPVPVSFTPASFAELRAFAATARYPLLLKASDGMALESRIGRRMLLVGSAEELVREYEAIERHSPDGLMVQEFIRGGMAKSWMYNAYFNERSECLVEFTGMKLRENPVYTGMTSIGLSRWNEMVALESRRFMSAIGYRGIVDIDLRYDESIGRFKILDVNPRVGATFRLFVGTNGIDVVRALYLHLTGQPVPPTVGRDNRKWFVEDKDLLSSFRYIRDRKLSFRQWVASYRGVEEAGYFAEDDPVPFITMCMNHVRRRVRRFVGPPRNAGRTPTHSHFPPAAASRTQPAGRVFERKRTIQERNMEQDSEPVAVVISAGGSPAAFDIVRALGMEGVRTTVASAQKDDIAFFSRFCGRRIHLPDFEASNEEMILSILDANAARGSEPPVLFYSSDVELSFVQRHRDRLLRSHRFLLPVEELLERLFNKVQFSRLAAECGLPIPPTLVVDRASELRSAAGLLRFPCIVKPAFSHDWIWDSEEQWERFGPYKKALRRIATREELFEFCDHLPNRSSGYLVQSYIEGSDEHIFSFHGYFDESSRCLGSFVGRKIRTYPPATGGSAYVQTTDNRELAELSIACLGRMGFQGIVKIDYKWDPVDRQFKILEINPRYNLWEVVGALAGVNLVHLALRHQRGLPVGEQHTWKSGVRFLYFKQDIRSFFGGYWPTKEWTLAGYLRSLFKRSSYRVFDLHDPRPFLVSSAAFLRRNLQRAIGREETKHPHEGILVSGSGTSPAVDLPKLQETAHP